MKEEEHVFKHIKVGNLATGEVTEIKDGVLIRHASDPVDPFQEPVLIINWAVFRWNDEVKNRPLMNIHRRTLDDTWRQVIKQAGGDDVALLGPTHDDLMDAVNTTKGREEAMAKDFDYRKILKAYLRYIGNQEGTTFLGRYINNQLRGPDGLNDAEALELEAVDKEIDDE
jgi:hypothetical protein